MPGSHRKILLGSSSSKIPCQISLKNSDSGLLPQQASVKAFITGYCDNNIRHKQYYISNWTCKNMGEQEPHGPSDPPHLLTCSYFMYGEIYNKVYK